MTEPRKTLKEEEIKPGQEYNHMVMIPGMRKGRHSSPPITMVALVEALAEPKDGKVLVVFKRIYAKSKNVKCKEGDTKEVLLSTLSTLKETKR